MNKYIHILLVTCIAVGIASCTSKTSEADKKDETRVLTGEIADASGTHKLPESKNEQTVQFRNNDYHLYIERVPSDSLPRVKNESGDTFYDNTITLKLTRGSQKVLNRKFTKHSFASVVPTNFMKNAILEGMVYDKTSPDGIVFAVSVCYPQTDLYIPISLTVDAAGKISIVKDDTMEEDWEDQSQEQV